MITSNQIAQKPQKPNDLECESLLDELLLLLEKQIKLAQQGSMTAVAVLCEKADPLVRKISQAAILDMPEFNKHRQQLKSLYGQLALAVSADKAQVAAELSHIHKGKKTLKTYVDTV